MLPHTPTLRWRRPDLIQGAADAAAAAAHRSDAPSCGVGWHAGRQACLRSPARSSPGLGREARVPCAGGQPVLPTGAFRMQVPAASRAREPATGSGPQPPERPRAWPLPEVRPWPRWPVPLGGLRLSMRCEGKPGLRTCWGCHPCGISRATRPDRPASEARLRRAGLPPLAW